VSYLWILTLRVKPRPPSPPSPNHEDCCHEHPQSCVRRQQAFGVPCIFFFIMSVLGEVRLHKQSSWWYPLGHYLYTLTSNKCAREMILIAIHSITPSISQSISRSINQSIYQSIARAIDQSVSQSVSQVKTLTENENYWHDCLQEW
jgi:hypothetical protein